MGNTKKASKKRLLRRKTKKHDTSQSKPESNANPAAGMSRLEYQQALMDPRFRAAMIGFNGSVGMGSQQSAQLRELEMKSNDIIRNINFQEQKMNLAKNLEEKKTEERKLKDDYEEKQMKDKYLKELRDVKTKINRIQASVAHQEVIDPLNEQLSNMKEEDDIKQQERRYNDESTKLKRKTKKLSRQQQIEDDLAKLKEQKDKTESEYERTQLERQYRDKRRQYEQEKARLEEKLKYDVTDEYENRELKAAIEMDRAEKSLEQVKYIAELNDRAIKATRATKEAVIKLLGSDANLNDHKALEAQINKMRTDALRSMSYSDSVMRDVNAVSKAYNDAVAAKQEREKKVYQLGQLLEHKPDPIYEQAIKTFSQDIETKKRQNDEIKKIRGDIETVINDNDNAMWKLNKTFDEFMTKNPNAIIIGRDIAFRKRGDPKIEFEDWPDILNTFKEYDLSVRDIMFNPLGKLRDRDIERKYNELIDTMKTKGIDPDKVIQKYRDDVANITELQARAKQNEETEQYKGLYASIISGIHDKMDEEDRKRLTNEYITPAIMSKITHDTVNYNNGVYEDNEDDRDTGSG